MESFLSLLKVFTDKTLNFYSKATLVLLFILLLVFIDNTLNYVYFQNVSKKVNYISTIGDALEDKTLTSKEKNQLLEIRKEILSKPSYKSLSHSIIYQLTSISLNNGDSRNSIIHFLSSTWWILLFISIMIVLIPFMFKFEKNQPLIMIIGSFCLIILALGAAFLISKLFFYIPQISETPVYNYLLNFALSSVLLFISIKTLQKKNKRMLYPK